MFAGAVVKWRWGAAVAVGALAIAALASAATPSPNGMVLTSGGTSVLATQGSYCGPTQGGSSICADYAYPLPVRCKLPVKRGATVTVLTARPARALTASLIPPGELTPAKRLHAVKGGGGADGRSWRFRLPMRVRDFTAIDAAARYEGGDSDTWTGLATRACRSAEFSKGA